MPLAFHINHLDFPNIVRLNPSGNIKGRLKTSFFRRPLPLLELSQQFPPAFHLEAHLLRRGSAQVVTRVQAAFGCQYAVYVV